MTSQRLTTLIEDVEFDAAALASQYDNECQWLVALSDWQISVILSTLRYAEWPSRWKLGSYTWDEIEAKISQLEHCLMAGCNVSELLDKFDTLNGYMEVLIGRFVTIGGDNIAEVTQTQELSAICSPDVTVNCGGGGGGICDAGTIIPPDVDTGGSEPPSGMEEPPYEPGTPEFDERKCRWANLVYDDLLGILIKFDEGNVIELISIAGTAAASTVIIAILLLFAVGTVAAALIGTIAALIIALAANVDLVDLIQIMTDNHQDLVCALYSGENGQDGLDMFMQVLTDNGATQPQINLITVIMAGMGWNLGYWAMVENTTIEDQIMAHEITIPCTNCLDEGVFDFTIDEQGWLIDETGSTNGEYDEENSYFWGHVSGSGTARLIIYYPIEKVTIDTLRMWISGTLGQIDRASVEVTDDVTGEISWTQAGTQTNISTDGFTMVEFTDLAITDKYIGIYLERFWSGPAVVIQRVEWE